MYKTDPTNHNCLKKYGHLKLKNYWSSHFCKGKRKEAIFIPDWEVTNQKSLAK